ncbi:hypothetical protein ACFV6F_27955 [Kitasatospora phosalacinea]|uniref:hypothetical protein n=1 Tax=Kitasatospora phosalacinea TaxID=2065 RepID=UPI00365D8B9E
MTVDHLMRGAPLTGGLTGLAALAGAPWWVVALGAVHIVAAAVLGLVQAIVPQSSADRRRVWEVALRRPTSGASGAPVPPAAAPPQDSSPQ